MIRDIQLKALLCLVILISYTLSIQAQNATSLYYLENLPQNNFINAAMMPRANVFIGLPLVNSIYSSTNSDLSAGNLLQNVDNKWVHPLNKKFDYNKLYPNLNNATSLSNNESISTLYFGFRTSKGYFTFSTSEKVGFKLSFPSDLFKMTDKGFPDGSSFDLSPFGFKAIYYREISFGYSHEINKNLILGAHIKPLFGLSAVEMSFDKFQLNTSREVWNLDMNGSIHTSAPLEVTEGKNGIPDSVKLRDMETQDLIDTYGLNFSNPGLAVDLGAVYKLNEAWSFSAALNNVGFITWKKDLNSVSVNGQYDFTGPSISALDRDSLGDRYNDIIDSVKNVIGGKTGNERFTTTLSPVMYLGGLYRVNHVLSLGLLSRSVFEKKDFRQDFSASANINLYHFLTFNANYNVDINGNNDFGLGFALRTGPLQFYLLADHLPTEYNMVDNNGSKNPVPFKMETATVMLGINLIFGANGYKDKPMMDSYSEY